MPSDAAQIIQSKIKEKLVFEAQTLLSSHADDFAEDVAAGLHENISSLIQWADQIIHEAEAKENQGAMTEAQKLYERALSIAADYPGLEARIRKLDSTLELTWAVRHRRKRRQEMQKNTAQPPSPPRRLATGSPLLKAMALAAIVLAGLIGWKMTLGPNEADKAIRQQARSFGDSAGAAGNSPTPAQKIEFEPAQQEGPPPLVVYGEAAPAPSEPAGQPALSVEELSGQQEDLSGHQSGGEPAHLAQQAGERIGTDAPPTPAEPIQATVPDVEQDSLAAVEEPDAEPEAMVAAKSASPPSRLTPMPEWYEVQSGDSLSVIADRIFCNESARELLFMINHDLMKDPRTLEIGQKIRLRTKTTVIKSRCNPPE